jgi:nitrate reductase NapAB chaperone NapD
MPVCSYLVIPDPGATDSVLAGLRALPGCDATRAENRDVIVLVTDTESDEQEAELTRAIHGLDGILTMVLTFGDIDGAAPLVQLDGPGARGGAA